MSADFLLKNAKIQESILVANVYFIIFAIIKRKYVFDMDTAQKKYSITSFEDEMFVQECLEAFDENVAKIEKGYAVTSKSA